MKFTCEIVKYVQTENERVERQQAQSFPLADCVQNFYRGSLFLIKESKYHQILERYEDQYFVLATSLTSNKLSWQSYSGYHTGDRTLLDFIPDVEGKLAVSSKTLLAKLESFFKDLEGYQFKRENVFYIDGWLEIQRSSD